MRFYKIIQDDYIVAVGTGAGGKKITSKEYDELLAHIKVKPTPPEGFDYRLRTDLTWEEYELPPAPEEPDPPETEPTIDEMLAAITEGVNAI